MIQGCWLDWEALKCGCGSEVADLLPEVELTPLTGRSRSSSAGLLATIPVQLVGADARGRARGLVADPRVAGRGLGLLAVAAARGRR